MYAAFSACRAMSMPWRGLRPRATTRKDAAGAILYAAEKATQIALDAVQILGGNGTSTNTDRPPLARCQALRDRAGTSEIRRMLIGRELFEESA